MAWPNSFIRTLRTLFSPLKGTIGQRRILFVLSLLFVSWILGEYLFLPSGKEFQRKNPQTTSLMRIRSKEIKKGNRGTPIIWVPLQQISPLLQRAVIIAEDSRFYSHHGFDLEEIVNSVKEAVLSFKFPRGASTLTQQLAKNLYLSESRTPLRKIKEAIITLQLERHLSKKRILELYLNCIEWGEGIFGIEAASRFYFHKPAATLSSADAAFLAAIIPNPRETFNPFLHKKRVLARQRLILKRLQRSH